MADEKSRVKSIIMDKAPSGNALKMGADMGFTTGDMTPLADAFNLEFNIHINGSDLQPLATVEDVVNFVINQIP